MTSIYNTQKIFDKIEFILIYLPPKDSFKTYLYKELNKTWSIYIIAHSPAYNSLRDVLLTLKKNCSDEIFNKKAS